MKWNKSAALKTLKYAGFALGLILVIMAVFPVFFKDKVNAKVKDYLQSQVTTELSYNEINLTFFRHFPTLTVSLDEVFIRGAAGFVPDTLVYATDLSLGINVLSVFSEKIEIKGIYLNQAKINILRDTQGHANFDIFPAETDTLPKEDTPSDFALDINNIKILKLIRFPGIGYYFT
jgi:AsmA protein